MNRDLKSLVFECPQTLARIASLLVGAALLAETSGCASRRPAAVLVESPASIEPTCRSDQSLNLKLVTYNIWGLPSWLTGAPRGRYPKIARELERLDADFILLQEAWTANARRAVPRHGHWAVARAARQHTFFQQSGLVTLSKFPIVGGRFYPFTRAAYPDRFVNKGVLKITVRLPGGELLNVWNAHLQDGGATQIRASQIRELVLHVQSAQDSQIADLVAGDFNCPADSSLYRELADSLGANMSKLAGVEPFVTWDELSAKPGHGQTIDYVFIRERTSLQLRKAGEQVAFEAPSLKQRLSDHFGIEATVSLTSEAGLASAVGQGFEGPHVRAIVAKAIDQKAN